MTRLSWPPLPPKPSWPPRRPLRLRPGSPLLIALLAAALFHALALSFMQLRASRQAIGTAGGAAGPTAPGAGDDTPELLRLSRRLAQGNALPPLILPPSEPLPPPPPELERAGRATTTTTAARPGRRQPSGTAGRSQRAGSSRRLAATASATAPAAGPRDSASSEETPQALITQARRQLSGAAEAGPPRAEGPLPAAWQQLWDAATPGGEPPAALADLGGGVELRRLPQTVLIGDRLLLLWRDGSALWLIRVARERKTE